MARIWRSFGLQPWRTETFKVSPDPLLIDKVRDVVGLYLAPPANAAVLSVDEKPQIQALQRTAPVLPMLPGVPERRSFDYERHGTTDLSPRLAPRPGKSPAGSRRSTGRWTSATSSTRSTRPSGQGSRCT